MEYQVIIIGGGLAGLTNAIQLGNAGISTLLIEKKEYPFHKVCGEYISNEVLDFLQRIGADPMILRPKEITRFRISAPSGTMASCDLPLGAFSVSRYALDNHLYEIAKKKGVHFALNTTVSQIEKKDSDHFQVETIAKKIYTSRVVIGAHGKRSNLDKSLERPFFEQKTQYVGIKHHFKGEYPNDLAELHNFRDGYCGVSRVENNNINICYLTTNKVLKAYPDIREMERVHLSQNPRLKEIFDRMEPVFEKPLVISQVNFSPKNAVENNVLMSGDAAGLITPLNGNGMAMAIHSAKMCAEVVIDFVAGKIDRNQMEAQYTNEWDRTFRKRLVFGKNMQTLFGRSFVSETALRTVKIFPGLLKKMVAQSHGKPI